MATGRLLSAGWMLMILVMVAGTSGIGAEPVEPGAPLDPHLDKTAPRQEKGLRYVRGGNSFDCMECHRSLKAKWHLPQKMMEHGDLKLNHGSNRFCLNCHHPQNRNVYVDYDGSEIAEEEVIALCAKCHGPQYRDWRIAAHGRRNGNWDLSRGSSRSLSCIECHDPHDPKFKPMAPMRAPTYPDRAAGQASAKRKLLKGGDSHGE